MLPPVYGQDHDVVAGHAEVHSVRKAVQNRAPRFWSDDSKLHRVLDDACDCFI
jgi:hypothetical protein